MKAIQIVAIIFSLLSGITYCLAAQTTMNNNQESTIQVIVIDPGHGGRDFGAVSGKAREKDIVLDIALKLGNYISEAFPEIRVIYTRTKDVFVPLYQRANIANKNDANLFISIHVNAVSRGVVQGTESYVLGQHRTQDNLEVAKKENEVILLENNYSQTYEGFDPNSSESYIMFELVQDEYLEQSVKLASAIQNQFRERANRIDRSVKQAGFLVLRQTTMPSVLVETGFLSHPSDRDYLMSNKGRDYLASAMFRAFREYKSDVEQKSVFHFTSEADRKREDGSEKPVRETSYQRSGNKREEPTGIWFSVQIVALKEPLELESANFKGENSVFVRSTEEIHRYFSGKFNSLDGARNEKQRLESKFNDAFVVAFENDELISVKKAVKKM